MLEVIREQPARIFLCAACRAQVVVCSRCDRGPRYCAATSCATTTPINACECLSHDHCHRTTHPQPVQNAQGRAERLHETSRFVREDGRWYYIDGQFTGQE